ncbi:MAG: Stealth CR1 domain-containing protein [Phascolarctobacterium sp.]|nr:Stealth CR1 domain-containing protein [Phascolarctobacterium sp.]
MNEKIDFVITWVDGNDEEWRNLRDSYNSNLGDSRNIRFREWDLLRYWFRGVEKFAPWVNRIHFVTCGHLPEWLNINHPKLHIVNHKDYIPEKYLPTFNSHTIELNLHRIEELEERFVYFNDDVFLINKVKPEDFFVDGLPCDIGVLGCISPGDKIVSNVVLNNLQIINKYFNKESYVNDGWWHAFNWCYGKNIIRTILLCPFRKHTGFFDHHLCVSFNKETFKKVWLAENELLHKTCSNKFRSRNDVSPWLVRYWQIASCSFYPHKVLGKYFVIGDRNLVRFISRQEGKIVCCNDIDENIDFEVYKNELQCVFEMILPDKSKFEK